MARRDHPEALGPLGQQEPVEAPAQVVMTVFPVSMAVQEQVAQMEQAVHLVVPAPVGRMEVMEQVVPQARVVVLEVVALLGQVVHQGLVVRMVVMVQVESPEQMVRLDRRGQLEHLVQAVLLAVAGLLAVVEAQELTAHQGHQGLVE
jgi:hypothetical protein